MGVPSFTDLGKSARDVFKTGYHYGKGLMKLNVKTKSSGNFEMGSDLSLDCDSSKLNGWMDAKYNTKDYGVFTEKWSTEGALIVGYDLDGKLIKDIGLKSEIFYNPGNADKAIKIGTKCDKDKFNASCAISSDLNSNVHIIGSVVTAFKDLFVGYQGAYNTETNKMAKNDLGVAFSYRDVGFHFRWTSIPHEYGLSVLYKVNSDWDAAINGILARSGNMQEWTVGAGAKYSIDNRSSLRFKFNTDLQLGTSVQQKLDDNVTLSLSFNVDCANVTKGGHKVGVALEIEA